MSVAKVSLPWAFLAFLKSWGHIFYIFFEFSDFLEARKAGLNLNPDTYCNQKIKFGTFFDYAINELKVDGIATGHYAGNTNPPLGPLRLDLPSKDFKLLRAVDKVCDQTFFLSHISQEALQRTLFPIYPFSKEQVRKFARDLGFDSICSKRKVCSLWMKFESYDNLKS